MKRSFVTCFSLSTLGRASCIFVPSLPNSPLSWAEEASKASCKSTWSTKLVCSGREHVQKFRMGYWVCVCRNEKMNIAICNTQLPALLLHSLSGRPPGWRQNVACTVRHAFHSLSTYINCIAHLGVKDMDWIGASYHVTECIATVKLYQKKKWPIFLLHNAFFNRNLASGLSWYGSNFSAYTHVCVCVRERERERER